MKYINLFLICLVLFVESSLCSQAFRGKGDDEYFITYTHRDCRNLYVCEEYVEHEYDSPIGKIPKNTRFIDQKIMKKLGGFTSVATGYRWCKDKSGKDVRYVWDRARNPFGDNHDCDYKPVRIRSDCYQGPYAKGIRLHRNVNEVTDAVRCENDGWCLTVFGWCKCQKL